MFPRRYFAQRHFPGRYFPHDWYKGGDALRIYLTGAASDGGSQDDPDLALGNYRASTEVNRGVAVFTRGIPGITIENSSRDFGKDGQTASIQVRQGNTLVIAAAGGSSGTPTAISNSQSVVVRDGSDRNKWIRFSRTTSSNLSGNGVIEFADIFSNLFSMADADDSESGSGGNRYRGLIVQNAHLAIVESVKVYIGQLGTSTVSSGGVLGSSGSGTITGPSEAFCDWPTCGWCRVETSANSLREIVYYTSRTDTVLTVGSDGRGRLGTSAAAGATDDNLYSVPGIRIAIESPSSSAIQTIANESTAPTSVTWSTGITSAGGLSIGDLSYQDLYGVWIHRELPANTTAIAKQENTVFFGFTHQGVSYTQELGGLYRVADDDLEGYELYLGEDSEPDLTASPDETFSSLPHTTTATIADNHVHYLVLQYRNKYNLVSQNIRSTVIDIDSSGDVQNPVPADPVVISWLAVADGKFRIKAVYFVDQDNNPADTWVLYFTSTGTDPSIPSDLLTTVEMVAGDGAAYLDYTTSAFSPATVGKIIVIARRSSDTRDSTDTTVYTATATTTGPATPSGVVLHRGVASQGQA